MAESNVEITAHCLCKANTFTTAVLASSLPIAAFCCHCNSCRHTTGALYLPCAVWPNHSEDLSALKRYPFSPNLDYFSCPTCGTNLFCKGTSPEDPPEVITGSLVNTPGAIKYTHHSFVTDTLDGGATIWLAKDFDPSGKGKPIPRWAGRRNKSEELPPSWQQSTAANTELKARPALTPLKCHCGGVDLMVRSAVDLEGTLAPELPWFVDPKTFRYYASTDACDSCRLAFGVDLPNWTFVALDHFEFPDGGKFPASVCELKEAALAEKDSRLGKLTFYQSSPDVERYFCGGCSAAVFYAVHADGRAHMVDVAVGLLHHEDGARAEGLLSWNLGAVGWAEDAAGGWREGLVKSSVENSEAWRVERGLPKCWRRVVKEEAEATKSG